MCNYIDSDIKWPRNGKILGCFTDFKDGDIWTDVRAYVSDKIITVNTTVISNFPLYKYKYETD